MHVQFRLEATKTLANLNDQLFIHLAWFLSFKFDQVQGIGWNKLSLQRPIIGELFNGCTDCKMVHGPDCCIAFQLLHCVITPFHYVEPSDSVDWIPKVLFPSKWDIIQMVQGSFALKFWKGSRLGRETTACRRTMGQFGESMKPSWGWGWFGGIGCWSRMDLVGHKLLNNVCECSLLRCKTTFLRRQILDFMQQ